jgi:hypothetical protein
MTTRAAFLLTFSVTYAVATFILLAGYDYHLFGRSVLWTSVPIALLLSVILPYIARHNSDLATERDAVLIIAASMPIFLVAWLVGHHALQVAFFPLVAIFAFAIFVGRARRTR